jgi:F-type H+-transporting ATPase subunit b
MADQPNLHESTEVARSPAEARHEVNLLNPEIQVMLLTWVTFFVLLSILYKFAWKPILQTLDDREEGIRRAVEEADKTRAEYEQIEETRKKLIAEAQDQAKGIVDQSRKAAVNAAKVIEQKTKEQAAIVLENAQREIKSEKDKADAILRQESVETAILLAEKIIAENLTDERNKKLVSRLLKEI